jgi:hypothetical protein
MKAEAINALQQFKEMHLAMEAKQQSGGQTDSVSESPAKPAKKINYPDHIKPLKERIMSALKGGCRTPESVATYCKEDEKLITMQLGRWVSRGLIGRHTNVVSGITRYYPHDIAKEKGFLTKPKPINRKGKKAKLKTENRSSSSDEPVQPPAPIRAKEAQYILFLEKRIAEWQAESRKQAHEILELRDALANARKTRDVTSEVTEVMQEVTKLRATVEYLESKLFGSK